MSKTTERLIQLGIIVAIALMLTCGIAVSLFVLNRMKNHDQLVKSQIDYNNKLQEQIGKPQEFRYIYPEYPNRK